MTSSQYQVQPEAVRSTVGNVGGIIMQAVSTVLELEALVIAPTSFANIGSAVASANTSMATQQVTALRNLLNLMQQVNNLVKRVVDDYDSADQAVANSYGGNSRPTTTTSGIWSGSAASQLATVAASGGTGQPQSVGNVLGYLNQAGLTQGSTSTVPTSSPTAFGTWLEASPDNQAALGVISTYSGAARGFSDVPGGVRGGDLIIIDPGSHSIETIGIVANNGQLYNNGLVQPNFGEVAVLSVYRPMSAS